MSQIAPAARGIVTLSVMAATMLQALDSTIANVALPHMQGSLSASSDQVSWVLTSYVVAAAIATGPTGYLSARFGRKNVLLVAITGFTIASMLCGIASSLPEMVLFRLLQGVFGAVLVPISQVIMLDAYPREQHGSAMALWGMGVMLGPILGPTVGGFLTEFYNWRWAFFINLPIGILAFMGLSLSLPHDDKSTSTQSLDLKGFAMLSLAIGTLQLMLDRGESQGWFDSREIMIECMLAMLSFYMFVVHSLTHPRPFFSPHLFADRNFVSGLALVGIVGVVMFATSALLPPFLQNLRGFPAFAAGLAIAPRGAGTMIAMWLVGRLIGRVGTRSLMLFGMISTVLSLAWMSHYTLDVPMWHLYGASILQGVGIAFVFVPLSTLTFLTLPARDRGEATSVYGLVRNVGSSLGIAGAFAYQVRLAQVNHAYLTEHITAFNPAVDQYLQAAGGLPKAVTLSTLIAEINRQAGMLATIADFKVMMWGVLLGMPLLLLFRPKGSEPPPERQEPIVLD
ncbi:MFS transporter, DHA2 family, multidrug resistance protein [Solimonas aquatica]|uniref:MFS transporter, DHA2 family, multidrug resistance protein n=1 Tax=Solimonas aquatica TaxID=489703 RepID=A0A1H9GU15_9GAMM|nr:DHA2 family efflux MFS transporter permease subunit [Solimonas aquatica]SEQ53557.1 MFS transporter, DHA2 family, multidrug resistance protein [Solimonas aquatica]